MGQPSRVGGVKQTVPLPLTSRIGHGWASGKEAPGTVSPRTAHTRRGGHSDPQTEANAAQCRSLGRP
jgi:hypothetical protein